VKKSNKSSVLSLRIKRDANPDDGSYERDFLLAIRALRRRLDRESKRAGCSIKRRSEIEEQLEDLIRLEHQECGTGGIRKHPLSRPSARELGFTTDIPSADDIFERAIIQQGLHSGKAHLMFARLSRLSPGKWDEVVKSEALRGPKRTRQRISCGDIEAKTNWTNVHHIVAENYFSSKRLRRPLRELSSMKAVVQLDSLGLEISTDAFDRALRRLFLLG
jgi:hypothetical protein